MRLEQWGVGKEHHRMASECPEYVIAIGVPIIKTSVVNEDGLSQIYQYLKEYHTVAFVGSSGVGKSTLINHILGTDHWRREIFEMMIKEDILQRIENFL